MFRHAWKTLAGLLLTSAAAQAEHPATAPDGLISVGSEHSVAVTVERLKNVLSAKGMTLFATVDHAQGAASVGNPLRPTTVVIFGNPKVGSPLMGCSQTTAIDLPQKALIWEDQAGKVWFSYNDPAYLKHRHHVQGCDAVLTKVSGALAAFANAATKADPN